MCAVAAMVAQGKKMFCTMTLIPNVELEMSVAVTTIFCLLEHFQHLIFADPTSLKILVPASSPL